MHEDQLHRLDMLVNLASGRKDRSTLIREAIDEFLETRIAKLKYRAV